MSAWLLGIVGVVSLGVLIEIIMPEGEHSKYIKGIFSLVVIFVIVAPFPKLLKGENIDNFFNDESVQIEMDEEGYDSIKNNYQQKIIDNFQKTLESEGYKNLEYKICFDDEYIYTVKNITILSQDLSDTEFEKLEELIVKTLGDITVVRS